LKPPPRILAIAGSDSSGGAGIQADLKTITMLGGYGMTAITAQAVHALPPAFVLAQIESCLGDIGADAIKIGMLGSPEIAQAVGARLERYAGAIVFDPVMVATSGAVLADPATIEAFAGLMDLGTLVTPNLPELGALTGMAVGSVDEIGEAAAALAARHDTSVLAKGGHGEGARIV
jgi:hydroxymethylpyrimidine/phosphomethylpyrimidine kinase